MIPPYSNTNGIYPPAKRHSSAQLKPKMDMLGLNRDQEISEFKVYGALLSMPEIEIDVFPIILSLVHTGNVRRLFSAILISQP